MLPLRLSLKNLLKHPLRFTLTTLALAIAIFLLCVLRSLVVALDFGVKEARTNRLIVQSAVSLFVNLPEAYEGKLRAVEGVEDVTKWQWFGAYYQDPSNFFAQYAVDPDRFVNMYREMEVVDGNVEDFLRNRTHCLVGQKTAEKYGFEVGDQIPLIGTIFRRTDGEPWSFTVAGIYRATAQTLDEASVFFSFEYLAESVDAGATTGPDGVGVYSILVSGDVDPVNVMAEVDALFENGPQRVQTTTEGEFNAQFISMVGNVPFFVTSIGGGVLIAILLAVVNTMLMAGREQTPDVGVLKALGFSDGAVFGAMLGQSLLLCAIGGALGILLALAASPGLSGALGTMFPGYRITEQTVGLAAALTLAIGLVAGIVPAWQARKLSPVAALRREV